MLEYAPLLRIVRRGIYKNKIVWLQDFRAIPRKKSGHCTKFCQILSTHDFLVICLRCRTDKLDDVKYWTVTPVGIQAEPLLSSVFMLCSIFLAIKWMQNVYPTSCSRNQFGPKSVSFWVLKTPLGGSYTLC